MARKTSLNRKKERQEDFEDKKSLINLDDISGDELQQCK